MSIIFLLAGLVFMSSGLLSILKITDSGLDFVSRSQIHHLPILKNFSAAWEYAILGAILVQIAIVLSYKDKKKE